MLGGSYGVTLEDAELGQDHYIAQTYLKHFGDGSKGGMLNAYRKSDGAAFACWPKDVCREWDGDINPLLSEPGLLGDFRGIFEPWWNLSVGAILGGDISPQEKFALSGYIANLMTCTPTWKRIGVRMNNDHMTGSLLFAKKMKERHGGQADLPVDAIE